MALLSSATHVKMGSGDSVITKQSHMYAIKSLQKYTRNWNLLYICNVFGVNYMQHGVAMVLMNVVDSRLS